MNPLEVRTTLIDTLRLDLVGPDPEDKLHEREVLPMSPSKWYLCGFLVPFEASALQRSDDTGDEQMEETSRQHSGDDETTPEPVSARKALFPSSLGLSVLVPPGVDSLAATVTWGDYDTEHPDPAEVEAGDADRAAAKGRWKRTPRSGRLTLPIGSMQEAMDLPGAPNVKLVVSSRDVPPDSGLEAGTRSVSVFVVNHRRPAGDAVRDRSFMFQVCLHLECASPFVPRPDPRGREGGDPDEEVADLQYRDAFEYAVGHNVSAHAITEEGRPCRSVRTTWIPVADVEKVIAQDLPPVQLHMEILAKATTGAEVASLVGPMVDLYQSWIATQRTTPLSEPHHREVAHDLLDRAENAQKRIAAGIALLDEDPAALTAFRLANQAIATALRQRWCHEDPEHRDPKQMKAPAWRPFQLAFLLMNLVGITKPEHADRRTVDLLFFPTGGGKTEAYLGLAAYTLVLRRLRNPGVTGAGMSVLMRYTLRLLTLDQLGRAATLVCALDLERQDGKHDLGTWPFEIGLWVGMTATPNRMGAKGDKDDNTARARTLAFQRDDRSNPSPIPIENCPWCGTRFTKNSFKLKNDADRPEELRVYCSSRACIYHKQPLPVLAVDDNIYRRLPAFLIATVDKFASLPWVGDTGALFGKVERSDAKGFYGPMRLAQGSQLPGPLPPPDLIIQDELHLISGPLGTMVGLYETAIDHLASRAGANGELVRPKIVASTATVRRATPQIRALFGRSSVEIFPPPGPDRRDSFFARTVPASVKNPRTYVGIAAQGRSLKVVLLRTTLVLMGAAQRAWDLHQGARKLPNPADPYMTVLGYFNSLRELGGSRRIVEDEITSRLPTYGDVRQRVGETVPPFHNRHIAEPLELTSRVNTNKVADAKRRLGLGFHEKDRVDIALATNMISVGLDITRLGLMVVLGQPKATAEYIQATSRVGRDDDRPGLVVALLNIHRPRDRSHFERFEAWHESFYRQVEATSVTPFSPRALDRGLAAVTVALARLGVRELTAPARAGQMPTRRQDAEWVADVLARRAEGHAADPAPQQEALRQKVKARTKDLLDTWDHTAIHKNGVLQYQREVGEAPPLLYDPLDPELQRQPAEARRFKAARSLRDVEPVVNLWLRTPDGGIVEDET